MPALTKLEVARRQLGTALWLFLEDLDPVSVHTLTGAGVELAEQEARDVGVSPFIEHILQTNPGMSPQQYYALSRQFYNAFKHALQKNGSARDDSMLLQDFGDVQNDALLFVGWTDLIRASTSSPIEAQVFQAWFYACYPKKLAAKSVANRFLSAFPPFARPEPGRTQASSTSSDQNNSIQSNCDGRSAHGRRPSNLSSHLNRQSGNWMSELKRPKPYLRDVPRFRAQRRIPAACLVDVVVPPTGLVRAAATSSL
jgi:hypothetical protein